MKVQRNSTQLITNTKAECAVCGATEPSQVLETTVRMELRGWWCGTVGCRYSLRNRAHSLPICSPNKYLRFSYSAHRMVTVRGGHSASVGHVSVVKGSIDDMYPSSVDLLARLVYWCAVPSFTLRLPQLARSGPRSVRALNSAFLCSNP